MSPNKKPAPKTNWHFFFLGMATFLVLPLIGIVLVADYPTIYKIITEGMLISIYLFIALGLSGLSSRIQGWLHLDAEALNFISSNRTSSFMSGFGLCFLLVIILFFGAMIWGVSQG